MTKALKRTLVPALERAGFTGTFPRYSKKAAGKIQLLIVSYDKAGTSFHLEFGSHPQGPLHAPWGEVVPAEKILLEHVAFPDRARLQERCNGGSVPSQWFRFGDFAEPAEFEALGSRVAEMLPQVEAWLSSEATGPNVSPNGG